MSVPQIDYSNVIADVLGPGGIEEERLDGDLADRFAVAHEVVQARRAAGEMGFFDLPGDEATAATVQELADGFGQWFENVVVLGIGGSSLGGITLREALLGPGWNELDDEARSFFPRLYVLENPDPDTARGLLDRLDLRKTLFNVISKSGTTAETMALYLVIRGRLLEVVDPEKVHGHFIFTTDPERGVLRSLSASEGVPTLSVPPNVGGRFSVLSSVGLFPAAITGTPVEELLLGARRTLDRCGTGALRENPAGLLATALHTMDTEKGRPIHVLMPYADRLRALTLWFQQLKRSATARPGVVPVTALLTIGILVALTTALEKRLMPSTYTHQGPRPSPTSHSSRRPKCGVVGSRSPVLDPIPIQPSLVATTRRGSTPRTCGRGGEPRADDLAIGFTVE